MNLDSSRKVSATVLRLVADRPQHADLLPALHDGAEGDNAQRRDTDEQAKGHEALEHARERLFSCAAESSSSLDRSACTPCVISADSMRWAPRLTSLSLVSLT